MTMFEFISKPGVTSKGLRLIISGSEYAACHSASLDFWSNNKPGAYGAGFINTSTDPSKVTRTGLLGQAAFSKVVDEEVDLEYREKGDLYDNCIFGKTFDIKCAARDYGACLIQAENESGHKSKLDKDFYVASFIECENRDLDYAEVILTGFQFKEDIARLPVVPARRGTHKNYELAFEKLESIQLLVYKIKEMKGYHD